MHQRIITFYIVYVSRRCAIIKVFIRIEQFNLYFTWCFSNYTRHAIKKLQITVCTGRKAWRFFFIYDSHISVFFFICYRNFLSAHIIIICLL